jgi:uncharacterized protein (TIGR00297 family)
MGFLIFIAAGWTGIAFLALFFLLGTFATSWKRRQKENAGMAQEVGGLRKTGQVMANAGIGGLLGLLALFFPQEKDFLTFLMAGAFSSATADTLSSELGTVYGKKFYNILTLKKDQKGLDGVISLEGTLFGLAGSLLIAVIYSIGYGVDERFIWIAVAGTIGNLLDSVLGATLERKGVIPNDVVNFLNTLVAALFLLVIYR